MHVLMVASEAAPWAKTGGLADVVGALPAAVESLGHAVTVVIPKYRSVNPPGARVVPGGRNGITYHQLDHSPRRRSVFVDAPAYFNREALYGERGADYPDNARRFAAFSNAALDFAEAESGWPPVDVVHVHDWQTGLIPVRLEHDPRWPALAGAGVVMTIHNLAYQGVFPKETVPALGLPWSVFTMDSGEFWGKFSFLKAGLTSADYVTTVSPTYAEETRTKEAGAGMDGVLRALGRRYLGILNGIDTDLWNPATDPFLPAHFNAGDLSGKRECKRALLASFGLPMGDDALGRPVIGMVSRLVAQKGLDLVIGGAEELAAMDATFLFLGTGEPRYERALAGLAAAHPARVAVKVGFDERLAHLVEAGADIFLMPSEFEPCGLNQMYSLRYGTVPIVRAVGGLDDTVHGYTPKAQSANGFKFRHPSVEMFVQTVRRAARLYHDKPVWHRLMLNGMAVDHSWSNPAREYVKVYRRARAIRAALLET